MKILYLLFGVILGFLTAGLLGFYYIGFKPDDKLESKVDMDKKIITSGFNETDDPAYLYFYSPVNSFGIKSYRTVNWSFFKQKFQNHFYKDVWYKRFSYSDWANGDQYVGIEKTWNVSGFWKINITLDVPVDIFEVNISFGCDIPVIDYIERDGYEIWLNYSANQSENYSVMFNWSDLANIQGLSITKHKEDGIFWISLHKNNVPSGFYVFDPTFGNNDASSTAQLNGYIRGCYAMPIDGDGTTDNITAKIAVTSPNRVKCALYSYTDYGPNFAGGLLATSTEITFTSGFNGWQVFPITYNVVNGTNYYILITGENASATIYRDSNAGKDIFKSGVTYATAFSDPLTGESASGYDHAIYCSYTVTGGEFSWQGISWSINGTLYNNTVLQGVSWNINGSVFNQTSLNPISWSVNGSVFNLSVLQGIDWSINGTLFNTTFDFKNIQILNGTVYNFTSFKPVNWSINGTLWNDTITWNMIDYSINGTLWNQTITYINITNPFPSDGSYNAPLQPYLYININSTTGDIMNISWYYGLTGGNENILLGGDFNISNSTQYELLFQASNRMTLYYWRVMADDGTHYINETFSFTTEGYSGVMGNVERINYSIIGIIFGIFGLIGFVFIFVYRKKNS